MLLNCVVLAMKKFFKDSFIVKLKTIHYFYTGLIKSINQKKTKKNPQPN